MTRTDFGARLRDARRYAKLTQKALAPLVGMSQSNLSELETVGHGSSMTAQLAAACGVNPHWLATGEGEMLSGAIVARERRPGFHVAPVPASVTDDRASLEHALQLVLEAMARLSPGRWGMVRAALDQMAGHPEMRDDVLADILPLLRAATKRHGAG